MKIEPVSVTSDTRVVTGNHGSNTYRANFTSVHVLAQRHVRSHQTRVVTGNHGSNTYGARFTSVHVTGPNIPYEHVFTCLICVLSLYYGAAVE